MHTELINANHPDALNRALVVLQSGGLVAFPTDTVYGIGALAFNNKAVEKIYIAKGRTTEKAIPILLGDPDDLAKVAAHINPAVQKLAAHFWPGPLTLVVPRHSSIPENLSPLPTVGVRIPNHPVARSLLQQAGPMAVSSANRSGQTSPVNAKEVFAQLGGYIPLILDGGQTPGGIPSTVVNCLGTEIIILRHGPISLDDIRKILA